MFFMSKHVDIPEPDPINPQPLQGREQYFNGLNNFCFEIITAWIWRQTVDGEHPFADLN